MTDVDVLLIEDTLSLQLLYASILRKAGYTVSCASTAGEGLDRFAEERPAVVILDLMLPDRDGLDLMRDLVRSDTAASIIVVTANGSVNRAVEAIRAGAHEFLIKPFEEARLLSAVRNALETTERQSSAKQDASGSDAPGNRSLTGFAGFVGSSSQMQIVYARIRSVADSMATIFVTGESGTGKEVCAQAVHDCSGRARKPFIPLNCGAIPSELLESEVFGHLKGSFTGAISDKIGAAAAADGGTLFLDEVCEMPLPLQTKLLRFLQTSTIQPVGATRPRKIDVRIICATNRDPYEEVRRGRFREDLFYRLHVIPVHLPALRDRGDDVLEIAKALLARQSLEEGKHFTGLTREVASWFRTLTWPGNVRQLQNALRHVVVLHDGPEVTFDMLPDSLLSMAEARQLPNDAHGRLGHGADVLAGLAASHAGAGPVARAPGPPPMHGPAGAVAVPAPDDERIDPRGKTLAEIERAAIESAIGRHGGSIPKAARELGVSPSTLYRKREAWEAEQPS